MAPPVVLIAMALARDMGAPACRLPPFNVTVFVPSEPTLAICKVPAAIVVPPV